MCLNGLSVQTLPRDFLDYTLKIFIFIAHRRRAQLPTLVPVSSLSTQAGPEDTSLADPRAAKLQDRAQEALAPVTVSDPPTVLRYSLRLRRWQRPTQTTRSS